ALAAIDADSYRKHAEPVALRCARKGTTEECRLLCFFLCYLEQDKAQLVLPVLREMTRHDNWECCLDGIATLGWFGPAAREAVPDLLRSAVVKNPRVRHWAIYGLGNIGPEA